MFGFLKAKPITPQDLAQRAQRILDGNDHGLEVDLYEHANPKDSKLKDLHIATLYFGLPEEWRKLDDADKNKLRQIIEEMRRLPSKDS